MDLFEDLKAELNCIYISDLTRCFRLDPQRVLDSALSLTFRGYSSEQWTDLFNYLQISFTPDDVSGVHQIRAFLRRYGESLQQKL